MASSITMTVAAPLHLVLRKVNYREIADELVTILEEHQTEEDALSLKLSEFGVSVLSDACQVEDGAIATKLKEKLTCLFRLLRNPIDDAILINPCLSGGEVWEEWMLDEYISIRNRMGKDLLSPFNLDLSLEVRKVHTFAKRMLDLGHKLIDGPSSHLNTGERETEYLNQSDFSQHNTLLKSMLLHAKVQIAVNKRKTEVSQENERRLREEAEGRVSQAVKDFKVTVTQLEKSVDVLEENYSELDKQFDGAKKQIAEKSEELKQAQMESKKNKERLAETEAQLRKLRNKLNEIAAQKDDSWCVIS